MQDNQVTRTGVSLQALEQLIMATPGSSGMNACVACCDRWAEGDRTALTWFANCGAEAALSYRALATSAARFANLLAARGVGPGDVVAGLLPRGADLLTVVLGTWRAGAVYLPLAATMNTAAIERRLEMAAGRATKLVVTDRTNRETLDLVDFCPPVLVVTHGTPARQGDGDFQAELATHSSWFIPAQRNGDDPFILLFTDTLGHLRPVTLKLRSLLAAQSCMQVGLDPRDTVAGWDTDDVAWSFSLYFSVMQPLLVGDAAIANESDAATTADRTVVVLPRSQPAYVPAWVGGRRHAAALQMAA
jgi:acetyl-CoA synthetase